MRALETTFAPDGSGPYQPASRRPIADAFRATAHAAVRRCVRWRIHPDAISYLSIAASAGAALCFWQARAKVCLLLVAPSLCYVRLWLNMLDGMVALAAKQASRRGEILNDLPDRISDVLVFAGVAHSGLASPIAGYWAAMLALMTAYVGMLGQAVGVHREFSGPMSKPWRMVVLNIGSWCAWGELAASRSPGAAATVGGLTILDWTCVVIVIGCIDTIRVRLLRILHALEAQKGNAR